MRVVPPACRVKAALRGTGQLLMTLGVLVLLFGTYSLYGTGLQTGAAA